MGNGQVVGRDNDEWNKVDYIVKMITGANVSLHSQNKRTILLEKKEGDPEPHFSSVSQQDLKSRLGNFRTLTGLVRNFHFYNPSDPQLSLSSLEALEDEASQTLAEKSAAESNLVIERSRIIHYFNGKGGLKDRSNRAKVHVKKKSVSNHLNSKR